MEKRTKIESLPQESTAVWEQLLRLAEGGDIRAIKLYYEMLEKKQRPVPLGGTSHGSTTHGGASTDMEPMAAIRRAVFGDTAVDAAAITSAAGTADGGLAAMVTAVPGDGGQNTGHPDRQDDGQDIPDAVEDW